MIRDIAVRRADNQGNTRRVAAVGNILFGELVCRRDTDRAKLVQSQKRKPELVMPFQDQHHAVAAPHAVSSKEISCLIAVAHHIAKGKGVFLTLLVAPEHRPAIRFFPANHIHNVVGKIKIFLIHRLEIDEPAVVKGFPAKLPMDIQHELNRPPLSAFSKSSR